MLELPKGIITKVSKPILSKRQEQIRRLIFEDGLSTKEVCSMLNVSEGTMKGHLTAIYKEYNVKSKYELLFKLLKNKLIEKGIEI